MATIEEIDDDAVVKEGTVDSDDDIPELEEAENVQPPQDANNTAGAAAAAAPGTEVRGKSKQNRSEKKARKAIAKLGLKPFPGVKKVTVKKSKEVMFVINDPEVMKNPSSETYVIFGEAKIEDLNQQAASQAARTFASPPSSETKPTTVSAEEDATKGDDDKEVDEEGLSPKDIELVMNQANCSRAKAVEGLRKNDNDIVNTIMELTM